MIIKQTEEVYVHDSPERKLLCAVVMAALEDAGAAYPIRPLTAGRKAEWSKSVVRWRKDRKDAVDFLVKRMHEPNCIYAYLDIAKDGVVKKVRELLWEQGTTIETVLND